MRYRVLRELQPTALKNCRLERFGEPNDGGYLMCSNLLKGVTSAYSYGISGYDQWGCDVSTRLAVNVHEYDCFNSNRPSCASGKLVFHDTRVLLVNKRIAEPARGIRQYLTGAARTLGLLGPAPLASPLDAPNSPLLPDCQPR